MKVARRQFGLILGLAAGLAALAAGVWWSWSRPAQVLARAEAAYQQGRWSEARTLALTRLHDAPNDLDALRVFARVVAGRER